MESNLLKYAARSVAVKGTASHTSGATRAVVLPFRVADTATMENEPNYNDEANMPPGVNIRNLREARGLSLREMGRACIPELAHTTITRIENNGGWQRETIERLAKALGVKHYQDLFLPPELFNYAYLDDEAKKRVANMVQDSSDAQQYRKRSM